METATTRPGTGITYANSPSASGGSRTGNREITWACGLAYQPSRSASLRVLRSGSCTPTTSAPLDSMIFASR